MPHHLDSMSQPSFRSIEAPRANKPILPNNIMIVGDKHSWQFFIYSTFQTCMFFPLNDYSINRWWSSFKTPTNFHTSAGNLQDCQIFWSWRWFCWKKAQKLSSHKISIGFYFSGMWMSLIRERKKFCFYLDQNALDAHKTHHQKIYLECQQF